MADEPAPDGLSDFSSLFRLPGTDESIAPVDLEQLKFMIRAILAARQFSPQGELGFDVRFLLQRLVRTFPISGPSGYAVPRLTGFSVTNRSTLGSRSPLTVLRFMTPSLRPRQLFP